MTRDELDILKFSSQSRSKYTLHEHVMKHLEISSQRYWKAMEGLVKHGYVKGDALIGFKRTKRPIPLEINCGD